MNKIAKQIIIKTGSPEEELSVAEKIHNRLVGNPDYIDSHIVLNLSSDRHDGTVCEVHLSIFEDSKTDIEIVPVKKE